MTLNSRSTTSGVYSYLFAMVAIAAGAVAGFTAVGLQGGLITWLAILGGAVVALGSLLSLEFGLAVLLFSTYIRLFNIIEHHGGPSLQVPLMVFLILLIVLRWIIERQMKATWSKTLIMFALYGASTFISIFFASDMIRAYDDVWTFAKGAIVAVVVGAFLVKKETIRSVFWTLISVGIVLATISVYQYLTSSFTNDFWGFGVASLENIVGESNDYRVTGAQGDPNLYAMILIVLLPMALERFINEKKVVLRGLAAWAIVVILMTVIFTFSRSGFLALGAVVVLIMIWRRPPVTLILSALLAVALLIPFLPTNYTNRILTLTQFVSGNTTELRREYSFRGRVSEWVVAWRMLRDHPLTGVGAGNYNANYITYSSQLGWDPRNEHRDAHSLYLEVAAEQGVMGIVVFGYILYTMLSGLAHAAKNFLNCRLKVYSDMTIAWSIGVIGYLTASIFLQNVFPYYLWMLIGISMSIVYISEQEWHQYQAQTNSIFINGN